jgi:uncharacterized protein YeaO (DUF488 family)
MLVSIKRVYETPSKKDGIRVLVDRLWPRGLTKSKAKVALWLKHIAPSTELRKWFNHEPDKWKEFQIRYQNELKEKTQLLSVVRDQAAKSRVTLVYAAKDERQNDAIVLHYFLMTSGRRPDASSPNESNKIVRRAAKIRRTA